MKLPAEWRAYHSFGRLAHFSRNVSKSGVSIFLYVRDSSIRLDSLRFGLFLTLFVVAIEPPTFATLFLRPFA